MSVLDDVAEAVREAAGRVAPAVVAVGRAGSGVVIGTGMVATNAHNVRGSEVDIVFADGSSRSGHVRAADVDADLAVVAVDTGDAPAVEWGGGAPELGSVVVALANPAGTGVRATVGTVSGVGRAFRGPRGRRIAGSVEHTAPLARGSSGGPLVDGAGRVVAINTHRLGDGFYLAVPADGSLVTALTDLGRGEAPVRPRLGVAVAPPHVARRLRAAVGLEPRDGLLIRAVDPDSAADRAGLRQGDLIVAVAGRPVAGPDDLHESLEAAGPAGAVDVVVVRGSEELTVRVTLADGTGAAAAGSAG